MSNPGQVSLRSGERIILEIVGVAGRSLMNNPGRPGLVQLLVFFSRTFYGNVDYQQQNGRSNRFIHCFKIRVKINLSTDAILSARIISKFSKDNSSMLFLSFWPWPVLT